MILKATLIELFENSLTQPDKIPDLIDNYVNNINTKNDFAKFILELEELIDYVKQKHIDMVPKLFITQFFLDYLESKMADLFIKFDFGENLPDNYLTAFETLRNKLADTVFLFERKTQNIHLPSYFFWLKKRLENPPFDE